MKKAILFTLWLLFCLFWFFGLPAIAMHFNSMLLGIIWFAGLVASSVYCIVNGGSIVDTIE